VSISFVNGYLCTSCADVAKAKRGVDPHPSPIKEAQEAAKADKADKAAGLDKSSRINDPGVVFGGSLTGRAAVNPASAVGEGAPASAQTTGSIVDFLA